MSPVCDILFIPETLVHSRNVSLKKLFFWVLTQAIGGSRWTIEMNDTLGFLTVIKCFPDLALVHDYHRMEESLTNSSW